MKRKTTNKKNLIYFTLTVGLIAGIWKITSIGSYTAETSGEESYLRGSESFNSIASIEVPELNETSDSDKPSAFDVIKNLEESEDKDLNSNLSDFRDSFNVSDPKDVKKAQRILQTLGHADVKEDGIFGLKTEAAWKSEIAELDKDKNNNTNTATSLNLQPKMEEKIVDTKTTTDNLTTLNSTKTTVSSNNSMLD